MFSYCVLLLFLIFSLFTVSSVNSMTLTGPVLTRYDPCGLGVMHFDRIRDNYWKGVLHFGLYSSLRAVHTQVYFAVPVTIYMLPNQTFDAGRTSYYNLMVKHIAPVPNHYVFHLEVNGNMTDIPIVSQFVMNNEILCDEDIKASQSVPSFNVSYKYPTKQYAHVCGRRSMNHTELVSTRTKARSGDWPWHVAILIRDKIRFVGVYDCGGSIISRTTVLTAGHCIFKEGELLDAYRVAVIAGTNNYKDLTQVGRQVLVAQKLILHPAYQVEASTSDLGIIKVNKFVFTEYVQPICLWGPSYDKTNLIGKEATIVGFGSTENDQQADILRSSNTIVQNDSTCIDFKPSVYANLINEFTLCVGFGPHFSTNPRNGDSGGGLIVSAMQPDHMISWMLRGVLSKCGVAPNQTRCDPTYYVVYTDVGPHYGWIHHHSGLEFQINV